VRSGEFWTKSDDDAPSTSVVNTPAKDPVDERDENRDGKVSAGERLRFWSRVWRATPRTVRKGVVFVLGGTLVVLGMLLVVLPGPFTLPLVLAGLALLATEFAWARRLLVHGRGKLSGAANTLKRALGRTRGR